MTGSTRTATSQSQRTTSGTEHRGSDALKRPTGSAGHRRRRALHPTPPSSRLGDQHGDHRSLTETRSRNGPLRGSRSCLLYTSDAADEEDSVDLGGRRIIKKKK